MINDMNLFIRELLTGEPVFSVMPSSTSTLRKVCADIPTDRPIRIADLGAGTGVFTRYLAERIHSRSIIHAIDPNPVFCDSINTWRQQRRRGPHVILECNTCQNVLGMQCANRLQYFDYILSGVPFLMFSSAEQEDIVASVHRSLRMGGSAVFYQTTVCLRPVLLRNFGNVETDRSLWNVPPLAIMRVRKLQAIPTYSHDMVCAPAV